MLTTPASNHTAPEPARADHELTRVLDAYADTAAEVHQDLKLPAGWCLTAAGVSQRVLAAFGYPGVRIIGLQICFFDAAASELFNRGVPAQQWPPHAWSVGAAGTGATDGAGWDGHAAALLPARGTRNHGWLIDVSASQFSRPSRGLNVAELIIPVTRSFMNGTPETHALPDGMVMTRHMPALTRQAIESCKRSDKSLNAIAAEVSRRMEARLATSPIR